MGKKKAAKTAEEFLEDNEPEEVSPETEALRREVAKLQRAMRKRQGATAMVVNVIEAMFEDTPTPKAPPRPKRSRKKRQEVAVVHFSDWQIGSMTEDFDSEIARQRIEDKLLPKIDKIIQTRAASAAINEVHILIGGDIVDGSSMRADHAWCVDSTVYTQAMQTAPRLLCNSIMYLMGIFPKVKVYSIRGNHGRSGSKKTDPNPKSVNYDTIASEAARLMLGELVDGERLSFEVEVDRFYKVVKVGNHSILLIHGDQFQGSGGFAGIPYYGIARNMAKWAESMPEKWDCLMLGHFHVPATGMYGKRPWYLNGTLQTGSDFALEVLASATRPSQRMLIMDPEHGVIADHTIWVD